MFASSDGINGVELWKSNGSAVGTTLLKDMRTGATSAVPKYLTNVGGTLFFSASDASSGSELWKSNATAGTSLFFAATTTANGNELWSLRNPLAASIPPQNMPPPSLEQRSSQSSQSNLIPPPLVRTAGSFPSASIAVRDEWFSVGDVDFEDALAPKAFSKSDEHRLKSNATNSSSPDETTIVRPDRSVKSNSLLSFSERLTRLPSDNKCSELIDSAFCGII